MQHLYSVLARCERTAEPVLITGETGVGKELVARAVHEMSPRADGPYVIVDCGTLSAELAESALFGHLRGAFTGADQDRDGAFARADGGTLFLDEIGELPAAVQPKLLRVLANGEVTPVGGETRRVDCRVVAATNRDLAAERDAGRFREDLYYRLAVVVVEVPPLRERRDDIPALVSRFLGDAGQADATPPAEILAQLTGYDWPGNVRELRNALSRVLALGSLPTAIRRAERRDTERGEPPLAVDTDQPFPDGKRQVVDAFERAYLARQLELAAGNLAQAARRSGLDRAYFKRLLRRHGLMTQRVK